MHVSHTPSTQKSTLRANKLNGTMISRTQTHRCHRGRKDEQLVRCIHVAWKGTCNSTEALRKQKTKPAQHEQKTPIGDLNVSVC